GGSELGQVVGAHQGTPACSRAVDGGITAEVACVQQGGKIETPLGIVHFASSLPGHAPCWKQGGEVTGKCAVMEEIADFMQTLSTGVYVIGVCDRERANAFTASSVMPVSFKPVIVAVAVGLDHASRP